MMSKLGIGQFDEDDLRLLEVLAGHASVALENARLYESLRREAENATAWLEFADAVSEARSVEAIGDETVRTVGGSMEVEQCSIWIEDAARRRTSAASPSLGYDDDPRAAGGRLELRTGRAAAARLIGGRKTPFTDRRGRVPRASSAADAGAAVIQLGCDRAAARRLRRPRLDHRARPRATTWPTSPTSGCACSTASPTAPRSRSRSRCCSSPSRRAPRCERAARVLAPAGRHGSGRPARADRRAGRRDARLAADVALARARPPGLVRDRGRLARRTAPCRSFRSAAWSSSAARDARSSAASRSSSSPARSTMVPAGDDPLAVAPVVLPSGRIGCIAAAAPEAFSGAEAPPARRHRQPGEPGAAHRS